MHLRGILSSASEGTEDERMKYPSGDHDNPPETATSRGLVHDQQPPQESERTNHQPVEASTLDDASSHFQGRSMRFNVPSRSFPVSAASSVQAEPSQEPETRDYQQRDRFPNNNTGQQHSWSWDVNNNNYNRQYPPTTNNKKTTATAAGLATFIILTILFGIRIGLMAGLFAAYAHDKEGILGDVSKAVGEVALITREKAIDINQKHKLVHRVRFALMTGWECATTIDQKNNAFKNLIIHGDVVWAKLVDAFHDPQIFQGHSFLREDMNNDDFFKPFLRDTEDEEDEDDVSTPFGIEPMFELLQAGRIATRPFDMEPIELLRSTRYGL